MTEKKDEYFHIKHGDQEFLVMTRKMHANIMLGDKTKAAKFIADSGRATIVPHNGLYAVLLKMTLEYQGEEMSIEGH